jgi:ferredoxin-thioredoxin reductase catalytic subunit
MNDKTLKRYSEIKEIAQKGGYHLNPDEEMTIALIDGLVVNNERYKDEVCPCRLFRGTLEDNLDIVCPCYYRDDDLAEYGACFCGLYVTQEVIDSGGPEAQVPERRLSLKERQKKAEENNKTDLGGLSHPV